MHDEPRITTAYLVRHGQTAWNRERRFQGHLDIPLDEAGLQQAAAVAAWLRDQPVSFQAIYSSDLVRATQTACAIGNRVGLAPQLVPALREIHCGQWAGLSAWEVDERYPGQLQRWAATVDRFTLPGGESVPEVQQRAVAFFSDAMQRHEAGTIVIVAHGVVLSTLLIALHRWNLLDAWHDARAKMGNTGVTIVQWDSQTATCTMPLFNSLVHLADGSAHASLPEAQAAMPRGGALW
jgi:broad specificity phosphatase PhoE